MRKKKERTNPCPVLVQKGVTVDMRKGVTEYLSGKEQSHISPLRPDIESMIQYRRNGLIAASDKLPDHTKTEVNTDLNPLHTVSTQPILFIAE